MTHLSSLLRALCLTALLPGLLGAADLHVAQVFTDHAVLQQRVNLPVWGTTLPTKQVTVRFAGQTETTQAAEDGSWRVELSPLQASHSGQRLIVESGEEREEFQDILVGEVWYASGQSNMQMKLDACAKKIPKIREIVEAATTHDLRFLRIDEPDSPHPLTQLTKPASWRADAPTNRPEQSAVAYFFARGLYEKLGVPIGIIEGSWGGKPIEGFIPRGQFEQSDILRPLLTLAEQDKLAELAELPGGVVIRNTAGMPGRIFNSRIAPIAPFALRGFIWYQGESNAGRGEDPRNYQIKMQALVDGMRATWNQSELPFYFVQLPAFSEQATGWIRLREEQRQSLAIQDSGMAVTIDLRDSDIHPANKVDVGDRLARWALAKTYGQSVPFSGPLFRSATVEGESMRVEFDHADGGLMVARKEGLAAPKPTPDVALAHFELADQTGKWHPAIATIDGRAVRVHSSTVTKPRAVRYACRGAPTDANLYNRAGLPASPFCSERKLLPWEPVK